MGNRGILHDDSQNIVSSWRHPNWVTCAVSFKGIRRKVFSPGNYSELFFLDEATAFSAGHRPCAACRRARFKEFKSQWCAANHPGGELADLSVGDIDKQLHQERAGKDKSKVKFEARVDTLPAGTMFEHAGSAYLVWQGHLCKWTHHGYEAGEVQVAGSTIVNVLTPVSIVRLFAHGFVPEVHGSVARR